MKALVFKKYGSPDVLQLAAVAKPTPQANEVLVKVAATAVNPADNHLLSGTLRFSTGLLKPKQQILGSDVAGWVAAVGANVTQFQVGDAVFGDLSAHGRGGFAEYVTAPAAALVLKPANVSFAEAAAAPMTAVTALQGLRDEGELQPGQQVLINGASGGVGTFAVQIAKALGAEVTAVASSRKLALVQAIGADHVIDYTQEDFTENARAYDLIFDTVGNRAVSDYARALKPQGRFVTTTFMPALLFRGHWPAQSGGRTMINMMAKPNRDDLVYLADLLTAGKVRPSIDRCYALSELPDALRYLGAGHAAGKVVIVQEESEAKAAAAADMAAPAAAASA